MSEISRQEFQRRRQALVEQMQPGSAALIFAAPEVTRSADSEYPYRQNSDFWYFTGFNEPEAVLVLIKSDDTHNHSVLFNRVRDLTAEIDLATVGSDRPLPDSTHPFGQAGSSHAVNGQKFGYRRVVQTCHLPAD